MIKEEIFKMYDIRGVYGQDLTDETTYLIGKGLGTFFQDNGQNKVVVGRDNRISGQAVFANFTKGLLETGCSVVNLGIVLTPFLYFSWYELDANACAMITASHNPAQYNGFKCSLNKKPLLGDDYQKIKAICVSGLFKSGTGTLSQFNLWPAFEEKIKSSISLPKKLKVALDCGNGTASLFAQELLTELGCEVLPIFCVSDGTFPNHQPYPQKVELYGKLIETIRNNRADIGLSFDGDGDRLGVYDEKGNFIENDRLAMVFVSDLCKKYSSGKIVMNVSTSLSVIDYIKKNGGDFIIERTGYPYISEKMKEVSAIFGGEISGHFFFSDKYFGYDDALYAGVRILEILANSSESLSQMIEKLPRYFETREFRVNVPAGQDKFKIINEIKEEIKSDYPSADIIDIDGIRFSFDNGWGLIRASNTESLLTGRAEGKTKESLEEIKGLIKRKLGKYGITVDF